MDFAVLGWEDVAFRLDHRQFAYAGKFVVPGGKAAALEPNAPPIDAQPTPRDGYAEGIVAAVSFSADRTDSSTLWLRYVTVRSDRRGEGIGPRLAALVADRAAKRGYDWVQIAVNNPFAYEAVYKAGFTYTGKTTGIAELVCRRPTGEIPHTSDEPDTDGSDGDGLDDIRSAATYRAGLDIYRERDRSPAERQFCARVHERGPPPVVDPLA